MGSSAKKKKEKKKDFQKAKLKVGKTKAKADNFTDTSFKAKALVLSKQFAHLADSNLSAASQFSRHVSLLRHRSDSQRQESLSYLISATSSLQPGESLPEPVATLLPKVQPLLLDGTAGVREQLLKLLRCLPQEEVKTHADQLLLYTRAAMTHLSADIRLFSVDVLDWLVQAATSEVVSGAGAWVKTIRCFLGLLGWQGQATQQQGWSAFQKPSSKLGTETKTSARYALGLANYIRAGLVAPAADAQEQQQPWAMWYVPQNALPQKSNAFAHLNLFGAAEDQENAMQEDREDRQRVFALMFEPMICAGMEDMKRQGGELGRASAAIRRAIRDGMMDFEREE